MDDSKMSANSSDTFSDVTDPIPNPPIYKRLPSRSHMKRAGITKWLADAVDNKDNPVEEDSELPDNRSSSPPAPIARSVLRMLPVRRPIRPQLNTVRQRVTDLQTQHNIFFDNNSADVVPAEDRESMKSSAWQLSPPLLPHTSGIIRPLPADDHVDLEEWLNVEKLHEDGHMEELITEAVEFVSEASQHLEDGPLEELVAETIKPFPENSQRPQVGQAEDVMQGFGFDPDYSDCRNELQPPLGNVPSFARELDPLERVDSEVNNGFIPPPPDFAPEVCGAALNHLQRVIHDIRAKTNVQVEVHQNISEQYRAVRRHSYEQKERFPEFAQAVEEHALRLNPNDFHLPGTSRHELERAPRHLGPPIWASSEETDGLQGGMQPEELHNAIMRGDFDAVLDENCGDELIDSDEHRPFAERLGLYRNRQYVPPLDDPFVDPLPMIDEPDRRGRYGTSDRDGYPDAGSSLPTGFLSDPFVDDARDETTKYREHTHSNHDIGSSPPSCLQSHPSTGKTEFQSSPPASFLSALLVEDALVPLSGYLSRGPSAPVQSPRSVDEDRQNLGEHRGIINEEYIAAGQEFLERREVNEGSSSPDGEIDAVYSGPILSKDVKQWMAQQQGKCLQPRNKSPYRHPKSPPCDEEQEPFEPGHDLLADDLILEQEERGYMRCGAALSDGDLFLVEPSYPCSLSRSVSPLGDRPSDYKINDDEFNALVEVFASNEEVASPETDVTTTNTSKDIFARAEDINSGGDTEVDMNTNVDSSPYTGPLASVASWALRIPEMQVGSDGGFVIHTQFSIGVETSQSTQAVQTETALPMNSSLDLEVAYNPVEKKVLEVGSHVVPISDDSSHSVDGRRSSSTLHPGSGKMMSSSGKDVERLDQNMVMSEPEILLNSMEATSDSTHQSMKASAGPSRIPTTVLSNEIDAEHCTDESDSMDIADSDEEVVIIHTSPLRSVARLPTNIPTSALAPCLAPIVVPDRVLSFKATYKEPSVDKSTKMMFQQIEQSSIQQPNPSQDRDTYSLRGSTEAAEYGFCDVKRPNKLRPIYTPPVPLVAPQNPFPIALAQSSRAQGPSYSQFETQQSSQAHREHSVYYNTYTGFSQPIQGPMPQYSAPFVGPNVGQETHGHIGMSPVNASSSVDMRPGSHPRGRSNERRGRSDTRGGRGGREGHGDRGSQGDRGRRMAFSKPNNQTVGGDLQQGTPHILPLANISVANSLSQGPNTLMSHSPNDSLSSGSNRVDKARRPPEGTQRPQLSQPSAGWCPPAKWTGDTSIAPMSFSSQLPSRTPKRKSSKPKSEYPHKSRGELIVLGFVNQGSHQNALQSLNVAKQREGKQGVEISENPHSLNDYAITVTGPLHSGVRAWVTTIVPFGTILENRMY